MHPPRCCSGRSTIATTQAVVLALALAGFNEGTRPAMAASEADRKPVSPAISAKDLMQVQHEVQAAFEKVRAAVVAVRLKDDDNKGVVGAASGVIVSGDGLILTAAHVTSEPGRALDVILADGRRLPAVSLGLDRATDAAMIQLKPNGGKNPPSRPGTAVWAHVDLNRDTSTASPGTWCFAVGHPGGYDAQRGPVLRVGRIIKQSANALQTDCVLMGGDSGGPLFDLDGGLIGIHSQIWEGRDQNMHISMAPFLRSWSEMEQSKVIREWKSGTAAENGGWLGVATRLSDDNQELQVADVLPDSPAARVGLRAGDVIVSVDGTPMRDQPQFSNAISSKSAGEIVFLNVRNGGGERSIRVTLGKRPKELE